MAETPNIDPLESELALLELRQDDVINELVNAKQERKRIREKFDEVSKINGQLIDELKRLKKQETIRLKDFAELQEAFKIYKKLLEAQSKDLETVDKAIVKAQKELRSVSERAEIVSNTLERRSSKSRLLEFKK